MLYLRILPPTSQITAIHEINAFSFSIFENLYSLSLSLNKVNIHTATVHIYREVSLSLCLVSHDDSDEIGQF